MFVDRVEIMLGEVLEEKAEMVVGACCRRCPSVTPVRVHVCVCVYTSAALLGARRGAVPGLLVDRNVSAVTEQASLRLSGERAGVRSLRRYLLCHTNKARSFSR